MLCCMQSVNNNSKDQVTQFHRTRARNKNLICRFLSKVTNINIGQKCSCQPGKVNAAAKIRLKLTAVDMPSNTFSPDLEKNHRTPGSSCCCQVRSDRKGLFCMADTYDDFSISQLIDNLMLFLTDQCYGHYQRTAATCQVFTFNSVSLYFCKQFNQCIMYCTCKLKVKLKQYCIAFDLIQFHSCLYNLYNQSIRCVIK